jgi:3-deoxy-7-phosphoheptulonate synthase
MPVLILPITMPLSTDQNRTDDIRIRAVRPLIAPALLQEQLPASEAVLGRVEQSRQAICDVLHARDDRLLVVVGPCSIHDIKAALDYATLLQAAISKHSQHRHAATHQYDYKPNRRKISRFHGS